MDQPKNNAQGMNVICLYWKGDFRGRDFTENDVVKLRETVDKHIHRPYTFYCLTNDMTIDVPAELIELKHNWLGWWSKMELHRPDLPPGRTLYLDLDTYVIRNLSPILDYEGDLVMFDTRASKRDQTKKARFQRTYGVVFRYQAATMLFDPGCMEHLYDTFRANPNIFMAKYRSDQDIMGEWIPDQPTFPKEWMMKLTTGMWKRPHSDCIIITGQGRIPVNGEPAKFGDRLFRNTESIPWLEKMARGKKIKKQCNM